MQDDQKNKAKPDKTTKTETVKKKGKPDVRTRFITEEKKTTKDKEIKD